MSGFVEVNFKQKEPEWIQTDLGDGNLLEMKVVITRIVKYPNQLDDLGMPKYTVQSHNILRVRPK